MDALLPPDLNAVRDGKRSFSGSLLFSDISGFTLLTGRLADHGKRGTEELSEILDGFFGRMYGIVREHGGSVLSSAGDSMLVSFPEGVDPGDCASRMMTSMNDFNQLETVAGSFSLGIKTVLGRGRWGRFILGDEEGADIFLAGDLVARMAVAEASAREGELVEVSSDLDVEIPLYPMDEIPDRAFRLPGTEALTGEHRSVSAIFVNVTGFDPARPPVERIREIYGRISDTARKYAGRVQAVDNILVGGCRFLILFGAPVSYGNDLAHAVAAGMAVRTGSGSYPDLELRIGMDEGYAFAGMIGTSWRKHYTVIGEVVNTAAGLADLAGPAEICASDRVRRMTRTDFDFREIGQVRLRGRDEPRIVYTPESRRTDRIYAYGFVGRGAETAKLLQGVRAGGCLSIVEGDAGIGKTRFLDRLSGLLSAEGVSCYSGSADEQGSSNGLLASLVADMSGMMESDTQAVRKSRLCYLVNALEDSSGALSRREPFIGSMLFSLDYPDSDYHRLPPRLRRENLLDGISDLVLASGGPACIILEDIHNCSDEDLEAVGYVCRRIMEHSGSSTSLILSRRPDDREIPGIEDHLPETLRLGSLEEDALGDLMLEILESRPLETSLEELVRKRAGGNPFYLMQFLLYLIEEGLISIVDGEWCRTGDYTDERLPGNIFTMIMARIDRLEKQAKESLRIGSVMGLRFDEEVVRRVAGREVHASLSQCSEAGLTYRSELRALEFVFSHTMIKDVTYDSILRKRRRRIHGVIARILEEIHSGDLRSVSPLLAYHFQTAGEWSPAVEYHVLAGEKAWSEYRNSDAIGHYTTAVEILVRHDGAGSRKLPECCRELGKIYDRLGRYDEALECYDRAVEASCSQGSTLGPEFRAEVRLLRADITYTMGDVEGSLSELDEIQTMLEASGSAFPLLLIRMECFRAWAYCVTGKIAPAMEKALLAVELAEGLEGVPEDEKDHRIGFAYNTLATVHWGRGDYASARDYYQKALEIASRQKMKREMAVTSGNIGLVSQKMGELGDAVESFLMQQSLCEEIGEKLILLSSWGSLSTAYGCLGRLDSSMEAATTYRKLAEELPAMQDLLLAHYQLGMLALAGDRPDEADEHADRILGMPGGGSYDRERASALILKGMVSHERNDPENAAVMFDRARELAGRVQSSSLQLNVLTARLYLVCELHDTEAADALVREAAELTDTLGLEIDRSRLSVLRARSLYMQGDPDGSLEELEKAALMLRDHGLRPALADLLHFRCSRLPGASAETVRELEELEREMGIAAGKRSAALQIL